MPELPEVETVKRYLEKRIVGRTFLAPIVYVPKRILSGALEFPSRVKGKKILSLSRRGKYLIFHISEEYKLVFHLRMEGKLYVVDSKSNSLSHLSLFLPFEGGEGLAFYDVRKFGVVYLLKEEDEGPLFALGKEPSEIGEPKELYNRIHKIRKPIKEVLLDQSIRCGIGNIYADEICFAAKVSPFAMTSLLSLDDVSRILISAKSILSKAIEENGSTVRTYRASPDRKGSYQDFLKVYSREGKECLSCHKQKIRKRSLSGRGTSFCPRCQKRGLAVGVTGKIASGKSLAVSYFKKHGFKTLSCDEIVHKIYQDEKELSRLEKKFPMVFTPKLDKTKITFLLQNNPSFKRSYLSYINHLVIKKTNDFLNENYSQDVAVEVPLLFDSHREYLFQYLVGVETTKQLKHLKERGGNASQMDFNALNSYEQNRYKLDYILHSDGTKKELEKQVVETIKNRKEKGLA